MKTQGYLEYNKCDIMHRNVRLICLYVEITMTVSDKQGLAFRQMSTYVQRIAMMHRRNGRKTDIHAARKKSHASGINHTTRTKSKRRRSIPSSHAGRSFFFWIVGYHAPRKAEAQRSPWCWRDSGSRRLWERDLGPTKCSLESRARSN